MNFKILLFCLISYSAFSQVGIGTTAPTASLDINGNLRIRSLDQETNENTIRDSILVVSSDGIVKRVESRKIVQAVLKTAVKGKFSTSSLVNLTLVGNEALIPFDDEDFDVNDEFNTTTHEFVAKQDGIYSLYAQIKANSIISATTNFGLSVYKNNVLESTNSFANVSVLSANVTPPIRNVTTLISLSAGDTVTFKVNSDLLNLSLLGDSANTYFTIHQIR
ncbi:hypothetical protein [Lacinutrix sp. MedPE-SW]|uniref:hypothetical protein n=1 Tax=Lacinutrix sp. MedPE-SW TaxID=1860087 RepID=UPI0009198889|nr:hypothetical protein [Lacinutrix sp. MedPE-SW]OIQ22667.1 MAG: hypothetical protein BM549_06195 [Lacinutrix sp. MedPE-SW]